MLLNILLLTLIWMGRPLLVCGNVSPFLTRYLPRSSDYNGGDSIRRSSSNSGLGERGTKKENSTSLDKSWENAILFAYMVEQELDSKQENTSISVGIEITCTACYIKGTATTRFISDKDFNISRALNNLTDQVENEIYNLRTEVANYTKEYIDQVTDNLDDGFDMGDFDLPTMDVDLNIELLEIPEFRLEFQFDGLEVYMLVDTVLSAGATYTLNLYTSTTPAGFAVRHNLEVGVIFTIDLIVSVEGEIDISTGFHLKLDDGVTIELGIFSKEISNMVINGGEFEFLPVSVESAGVVFKAVLRVGIQAGFEISSSDVSIAGKDIFRIGAGIETGVYANIAELITNATLSTDGDDQCGIRVAEAYQFAVGATAGASIAIEDITWGPAVETEVPIFYTTLAQACAMQRSSGTISASKATLTSAALVIRGEDEDEAEMETTTISEEATFIAVACKSEGLVNCPASLQTTSRYTTTRTHVTVVPTDSEAFFPESVRFSSVRPIPFGDSARKLFTTSGIPGSYVPQPPTHSATISAPGDGDGGNENTSSNAKSRRLSDSAIIGLSVGLGVPFLLGGIALVFIWKRKMRLSKETSSTSIQTVEHTSRSSKMAITSIVELRRL
ncbi:hypothetical protein FPOAC2_14639 [Fusarium poae]|uniref:Mid2 domain-containing protein n=1 Tax=Fusarium poae TaxID=36050 RepID=A0A1B8AAP9_FUSPO|nr:hypothetical protein FPOA_12693 [Fusarium poae]OBS17557.1 hypothetical protein FPOA_11963 [Fusarium poae]